MTRDITGVFLEIRQKIFLRTTETFFINHRNEKSHIRISPVIVKMRRLDQDYLSNYRTISKLSFISKVLLIFFDTFQSSFREFHSTDMKVC